MMVQEEWCILSTILTASLTFYNYPFASEDEVKCIEKNVDAVNVHSSDLDKVITG